MIQFNCPHCDTELEAPDKSAGGKMACPDCGKKMMVPELEEKPVKKPQPAKKPAAGPVTSKKPAAGAAAGKAAAKSQRRRDDEDEDDDDSEDERPPKKKGSSAGLWIGLGVGGGVAVIGGVILVIMMMGKKDDPVPVVTTPPPNFGPPPNTNKGPGVGTGVGPAEANKGGAAKTTTTPPAEVKPVEVAPAVASAGPASSQRIYKRLLKSTVLIVHQEGAGLSIGSGSLIDIKNRVILTNHHVVGKHRQVAVFFPVYKDNRMISEIDYFLKQAQQNSENLIGTVLTSDPKMDAALVQLPRLPAGVEAIPFATARPNVSDTVYNVGHPGASGGLWVFTDGKVRQLLHKTWRSSDGVVTYDHDCDIILTNSATNHGDSGGPLVNERAQMVAIVQGGAGGGANLLSTFIDITEVRGLMDRYSKSNGMKFEISTEVGIEGGNTEDLPGLIKALDDKDAQKRATAVRALGEMGANAKSAIIYVVKAIGDKDTFVSRMALEALPKMGTPDKIDAGKLAAALKDPSVEVRTIVADLLGKMGPDGKAALPALVAAAKDADTSLRVAALRTLGKVGANSKEAVFPALTDAFSDSDREVKMAAADAMGNLTVNAGDLPMLVPMLKHKEVEGRIGAARAIAKIGPEARTAIKPLTEALADNNPLLRKAVLDTLATFNADAKEVLADIEKALKSTNDKEAKRSALIALGNIGVESKVAVAAIADCCKDFDLRKDAMATLAKIGPAAAKDGAAPVANVLKSTSKPDRLVALDTIVALKPTGPETKDVVEKIVGIFDDKEKDQELFEKAAETIGKIGKSALGQLAVALNSNSTNMRLGAAMALGAIGADAKNAVFALQQHSRNDLSAEVRQACDKALVKIAK